MTAFDLCRQHPDLELAPILRIVKYLGLDSTKLSDEDIARIVHMHPHFLEDPELVVGIDAIADRAGLPADTVARLLVERRSDLPYVGSPRRPMMPAVGIALLRDLVAPETAPDPTVTTAAIRDLEAEIDAALAQVRTLGKTLSKLSRQVRRSRTLDIEPPSSSERRRHRRSGGGRPDTIVEACRKVLEEAEGPMKVADITAEVVSKGVDIKAKNPNVTVSSILSSYEVFERVRRGYYTIAASSAAL